MLDGLPISLDNNRVPLRFLPPPGEVDFTTDSLYAALERDGPSARPRRLRAGGARGRRARGRRCWGWPPGRRCCSRPPSRSARTAGSSTWGGPSIAPTAIDSRRRSCAARRRTGRGRADNEETARSARPCRSRWRSPSPRAAGRRGRTSRRGRRRARRLTRSRPAASTSSARSRSASSPPRARAARSEAIKRSRRRSRRSTRTSPCRSHVPRLRELDQAGEARRAASDNAAGRVRGQPGLPARRRAREGRADPAAQRVRQGLRLGQVLHAGDPAAVQWTRRRQDVRQGHAVGRRPDRPVGRRVRQHGEAAPRRASIPRR